MCSNQEYLESLRQDFGENFVIISSQDDVPREIQKRLPRSNQIYRLLENKGMSEDDRQRLKEELKPLGMQIYSIRAQCRHEDDGDHSSGGGTFCAICGDMYDYN